MSDLRFVPTQDMVDELSSRFDHFVVAGYMILKGKPTNEFYRYYKGNTLMCVGLLEECKMYILEDIDTEDIEDGEETPEGV